MLKFHVVPATLPRTRSPPDRPRNSPLPAHALDRLGETMTLADRLTRTGITIAILGTIASQVGFTSTSLANTVTGGATGLCGSGTRYRVTINSDGTDYTSAAGSYPNVYRNNPNGPSTKVTLYAFAAPSNGDTFYQTNVTWSLGSASTNSLSFSSIGANGSATGSSVDVYPNSTNTSQGNPNVTATYTYSGGTQIVTFPVKANNGAPPAP